MFAQTNHYDNTGIISLIYFRPTVFYYWHANYMLILFLPLDLTQRAWMFYGLCLCFQMPICTWAGFLITGEAMLSELCISNKWFITQNLIILAMVLIISIFLTIYRCLKIIKIPFSYFWQLLITVCTSLMKNSCLTLPFGFSKNSLKLRVQIFLLHHFFILAF